LPEISRRKPVLKNRTAANRTGGGRPGDRAARLGSAAGVGGAEAAGSVDLAGGGALRGAAPPSDLDQTPPQGAGSQGGAGWHPVDRSADRRSRSGQSPQGSAWRVRERMSRLLRISSDLT